MSVVVTLTEAKIAARLYDSAGSPGSPVSDEDTELQRILDEAEFTVLEAVKNRVTDADAWALVVDAWTDQTVPKDIKGAIIRQFVARERFRGGDDPKSEPEWVMGLDPIAWRVVSKYGDPSLA